jgi:hypothetical protein
VVPATPDKVILDGIEEGDESVHDGMLGLGTNTGCRLLPAVLRPLMQMDEGEAGWNDMPAFIQLQMAVPRLFDCSTACEADCLKARSAGSSEPGGPQADHGRTTGGPRGRARVEIADGPTDQPAQVPKYLLAYCAVRTGEEEEKKTPRSPSAFPPFAFGFNPDARGLTSLGRVRWITR